MCVLNCFSVVCRCRSQRGTRSDAFLERQKEETTTKAREREREEGLVFLSEDGFSFLIGNPKTRTAKERTLSHATRFKESIDCVCKFRENLFAPRSIRARLPSSSRNLEPLNAQRVRGGRGGGGFVKRRFTKRRRKKIRENYSTNCAIVDCRANRRNRN